MSRWYRAYEGTVTDPKLGEAAMIAGVSRSVAIAAWHCLLESAAARNNCGSFDTSARRVAVVLGETLPPMEALFAAFHELAMIGESSVSSWRRRQFQSDNSKERVAKHRARKRQETANVTVGNGDVTPSYTETEKKEVSSKDDSSSGDEPELLPEHVFQHYQELAESLGRPVPRDFTPERRQLTRGRIKQYSLADFLTVFAKCRDSPFLRGDKGRTPLTYDWLMKKANFQKVLEGNYDG